MKKLGAFVSVLLVIAVVVLGVQFVTNQGEGVTQTAPSPSDSAVQLAPPNDTTPSSPPDDTTAPGQSANPSTADSIYYYYNHLDADGQAVYDTFLQGVNEFNGEITFQGIAQETLESVVSMVSSDHPEIFWFEGEYSYISSGKTLTVMPEYICTRAERDSLQQSVTQAMQTACATIGQPASRYETVKAVFEYVIDMVDYVIDSPDNQNIVSSMLNRQSVCAGYAREAQYLLQQYGMESIYVTGSVADRGTHAWLIVLVDGAYYQVDPTFGDRDSLMSGQESTYPEGLQYNYDYLCCSDQMMLRDRTVNVESVALPTCNSEDLNYYRLNGTYYETYNQDVLDALDASIAQDSATWSLQLANEADYLILKQEIQDGLYTRRVCEVLDIFGTVYGTYIYSDTLYSISCWYER